MKKWTSIALTPKPQPPKFSWWAAQYPNRHMWYAAAHAAADRLRGQKAVVPSDLNTEKFDDYWRKPKAGERIYADAEAEQMA